MKIKQLFETSFGDRFEKKSCLSYQTFKIEIPVNQKAWFWALNFHRLGAGPTGAATGNLLRPVFNLENLPFVRDAHYSYLPRMNKISISIQIVQKKELASPNFFKQQQDIITKYVMDKTKETKMVEK
jgi:hypothetical protein